MSNRSLRSTRIPEPYPRKHHVQQQQQQQQHQQQQQQQQLQQLQQQQQQKAEPQQPLEEEVLFLWRILRFGRKHFNRSARASTGGSATPTSTPTPARAGVTGVAQTEETQQTPRSRVKSFWLPSFGTKRAEKR